MLMYLSIVMTVAIEEDVAENFYSIIDAYVEWSMVNKKYLIPWQVSL